MIITRLSLALYHAKIGAWEVLAEDRGRVIMEGLNLHYTGAFSGPGLVVYHNGTRYN